MANNIDRLKTALINADKAGDTEAATKLAAAIRAEQSEKRFSLPNVFRSEEAIKNTRLPPGPPGEAIRQAAYEGTTRLGSGLKQLGLQAGEGAGIVDPGTAQAYTQQESERRVKADEQLKGIPGTGIAQASTEYGPFAYIPGGAARTFMARMGTGALQGGGAAGTQFMEEGQSRALHTGAGTVLGGGLNAFLAPLLSRVFSGKQVNVAEFVDEAGKITDKGKSLLMGSSKEGDLIRKELQKQGLMVDAKQIDNYNQLVDQGLRPTKAQVTRTPEDFTFQTQNPNAPGKGGTIGDTLNEQNSVMLSNADEIASKTGGVTDEAVDTSISVGTVLRSKADELDAGISEAYNLAKGRIPGNSVNAAPIVKAINDLEHFGQKSTDVALGELKLYGVIDKEGNILRKMTVDEGERVRQALNTIYDPAKPTRNIISREIKDVVDEHTLKAAGKDVYAPARKLKIAWHKEFTDGRTGKFDIKNKNILDRVINGSLKIDDLYKTGIKNGKIQDVLRIKSSLNTYGQAGKQAWDDIRGQVVRDALAAAKKGGSNQLGDRVFNMKEFKKVFDKFSSNRTLTHLFSTAELAEVGAFIRAGELRIPVVGSGKGLGPTGNAVQKLGQMIDRFPMIGRLITRKSKDLMQFSNAGAISEEVARATQPGPTIERAINKITRKPVTAPIGVAALGGR